MEGLAGVLLDSVYDCSNGVAEVLGGIGSVVDEIGRVGDGSSVYLEGWAIFGGSVDIEARAFGVGPEEAPAEVDIALVGANRNESPAEIFHLVGGEGGWGEGCREGKQSANEAYAMAGHGAFWSCVGEQGTTLLIRA